MIHVQWSAMGTFLEIKIVGAPSWNVKAECRPLVSQWESRLTRFSADSDVARLEAAVGGWVEVSEITDAVLSSSLEAYDATEGFFDICTNAGALSAEQDIKRDVSSCLERRPGGYWRLAQGHTVDLGGIAKGIVAEQISDVAYQRGASGALINFGASSISSFGQSESGDWKVALRAPGHSRNQAIGYLSLSDHSSLSVSGFDERGHHILNPFSASPTASDVTCAAVLARHGAIAESWSTALVILGTQGLQRAVEHSPESKFALVTTDRILSSPHWFTPVGPTRAKD